MKNISKLKVIITLFVLSALMLCSYMLLARTWGYGNDFPRRNTKKMETANDDISKTKKNKKQPSRRLDKILQKMQISSLVENRKGLHAEEKKTQCGVGWQEKYIKYHQQILNSQKPRQLLVYFCGGKDYGCGGYGNRLNAITSLLFLAILTDRAFLIDWTYSISIQDYFLPKNIDWAFSNGSVGGPDTRRNYWSGGNPSKVTADVRRPVKEHDRFRDFISNTDFRTHFDKPVEIVTTMWYFADALQESQYFKEKLAKMKLGNLTRFSWFSCAFDFLFTKTKILQEKIEDAKKSMGVGQGMPVMGLHIRTGDKVFGKKSKKSAIRTKNYMELINCTFAFEKMIFAANPELSDGREHITWFLASDDIILKRHLARKYPWIVSLDVKVEHISVYRKKQNLPSREGMMGVLLDHFLLSECEFLVLSRSTFGLTAARLTKHTKQSYTLGEKCKYSSFL